MTIEADLLRIFDDLANPHHDGSAEPWVATVLAALLQANGARTVVEVGGFEGRTSRVLRRALSIMPGEKCMYVCEIDPARAAAVRRALDADGLCAFAHVVTANSLDWIPSLPNESVDFVWLDGNHEKPHVLDELRYLLPKMAPGGIIAGHDVFGVCDLKDIFGIVAHWCGWQSMSLDLPRLGPAGGIGIIQRPR